MEKQEVIRELIRMEAIVLDRRSTPEQVEQAIAHIDTFEDPQASAAIRHMAGEQHTNHIK